MRLCIEEICERYGISMNQLSDQCGIDQPALSDYNRGKRNPTLNTIDRIASSIGVPIHDLIPDRNDVDRDVEWFLQFSVEERLRMAERDRQANQVLRKAGSGEDA